MKKNKKGEIGIGLIIVTAVTIIVGAIFLQAIAQQNGDALNTISVVNLSLGTQTNGTTYYVTTYQAISGVTVLGNGTLAPVTLSSGNYTLTNNVIDPTTGSLSFSILPASEYTGTVWQITGTAQPLTYVNDSGSRAMIGLILIFFAVAVFITALMPSARSGIMDMFK